MLVLFSLAYFGSAGDPNFLEIISKPDNVPITLMIFLVGYVLWLSFRQAAINDARIEAGEPLLEAGSDDKVLTWPDLVYTELICMVLCSVFLIVWAIFFRAPLEPPANPAAVPNPSKAPWYFLGLQELLVYFDPWIAGVLLPGLIIFGLIALPYIDKNPKGNGYYTLAERPFAIAMYLFGFVVLWVVLIVLGTFLRGPNWNFFGPYEYWDAHRPAALSNVNLSELFWVTLLGAGLPTRETAGPYYYLLREAPGLVLLAGYFFLTPWLLKATVFKRLYNEMGPTRYGVMMILFTWMALVPIKMLLRWTINLKYIVAITEWFFNV
ncbi:MAG: cytochrome C [Phycisphaerae bacterium]